MVESTPDPGDGHCGIEVRLSEQRGRNHLWGRRLWQIRTFPKNPISPNKHFSFIWHTEIKNVLFQMIKSMTNWRSGSPFTQRKKKKSDPRCPRVAILGTTTTGAITDFLTFEGVRDDLLVFFSANVDLLFFTHDQFIFTITKISLHHLICGWISMWESGNSRIH